jgi:hypothetical protein
MNTKFLFSRQLMALAIAAACSPAAWAQTTPATETPAAEVKTTPAETTTSSSAAAFGLDSIFGATISPNQISFTPSYESGGHNNQPGIMTARTFGAPLRYDAIFVYPDLVIGAGNNDNLLGTSSNGISTHFISVRPSIVAEVKNQGDRYTASYNGNYTRFNKSSADDFNHHELALAGDDTFSSRARLGWLAGYMQNTDPRGSTDRTLSATPDKWHAASLAALFGYGAQGAIGRFEVESNLQDKRYDNNLSTTAGGNVNLANLAGRFFYRVAPKTSVLFELREIKSDYQLSTSTNTNTDRRELIGVTWEATAATTGIFKIGHLKKDFDSSARSDYSGLTWEGTLRWMPLTYSTVDLMTSRAPSDSTGVGDYILNRNESLRWSHQWNSAFSSRLDAGVVHSDYKGIVQQQTTKNYALGVSYIWRRWLNVGAEVARTQKSSNVAGQEFSRNVIQLTLEATL